MFEINYHPKVAQDLEKIDRPELVRIHEAIEQKLSTKPELYGLRLRGELCEYWKLRVGNYRIVYTIKNKTVFILTIAHRRDVYTGADKRI